MSTNQLLAALARTRPATYNVENSFAGDCRGWVLFEHWVEPIRILVKRPENANYITFAKYIDAKLAIRVTTPIELFRNRITVPDSVLCWATLERFDRAPTDGDVDHLIVRDGRILRQPRRGGSDARVGGSDARGFARASSRAPARPRVRARGRTLARTHVHRSSPPDVHRAAGAPRAPRAPRTAPHVHHVHHVHRRTLATVARTWARDVVNLIRGRRE